MAHKTLVGGTAYEIAGGKTLVGGTAYSIAGGKTLVGGAAYDVSFGAELITFYLEVNTMETYQAEADMTWYDFVNSSYNDGTFSIDDGYVYSSSSQGYVVSSSTELSPESNDKIVPGETYFISRFPY